MMKYRSNADGSAVCAHRDLSVCDACADSDEALVEVVGAHFYVPNADERAALVEALA